MYTYELVNDVEGHVPRALLGARNIVTVTRVSSPVCIKIHPTLDGNEGKRKTFSPVRKGLLNLLSNYSEEEIRYRTVERLDEIAKVVQSGLGYEWRFLPGQRAVLESRARKLNLRYESLKGEAGSAARIQTALYKSEAALVTSIAAQGVQLSYRDIWDYYEVVSRVEKKLWGEVKRNWRIRPAGAQEHDRWMTSATLTFAHREGATYVTNATTRRTFIQMSAVREGLSSRVNLLRSIFGDAASQGAYAPYKDKNNHLHAVHEMSGTG